jgi:ornithine cyclodeaminase
LLAPGTLLNALGAILPANAEFTQDIFDHAGLMVVDSLAGVQSNSREFRDRFVGDGAAMPRVRTLGEIIAGGVPRPAGDTLTLFKAMGMGISDLAVARIAIERARRQGVGTAMPTGGKAAVRWQTDVAAAE